MNVRQYQTLASTLADAICSSLPELVRELDGDVYALVLDANETSGDVVLCLSTRESIDQRIRTAYADATESTLSGISGVRFNPGEFAFSRVLDLGAIGNAYRERVESLKNAKTVVKHHANFSGAIVSALEKASECIANVPKSRDFVLFHTLHDADIELTEQLIRKTLSPAQFDSTFPEVSAYRTFLASLSEKSPSDQIEFWLELARAYALGNSSTRSQLFFSSKSLWDVGRAIESLDSSVLDRLIEEIEFLAPLAPFNEPGSEHWKKHGAISTASDTCSTLVLAIPHIGTPSSAQEERLLSILRSLDQQASQKSGPGSITMPCIARTLSALWPRRYPDPCTPFGNKIHNIDDYLSKISMR